MRPGNGSRRTGRSAPPAKPQPRTARDPHLCPALCAVRAGRYCRRGRSWCAGDRSGAVGGSTSRGSRLKSASRPTFHRPAESQTLRDVLIGELDNLDAEESLVTWAERRLPAKNTLGPTTPAGRGHLPNAAERICGAGQAGNAATSSEVDAQAPTDREPTDPHPLPDGPVLPLPKEVRRRSKAHLAFVRYSRDRLRPASAALRRVPDHHSFLVPAPASHSIDISDDSFGIRSPVRRGCEVSHYSSHFLLSLNFGT